MLSSWPPTIKAGIPVVLEAQLFESKKPVVLPRIGPVVRYAFQVTPTDKVSEPILREFLVDDGTLGDRIADDGIFSHEITIQDPGEYRLQLLATGPTFERHQQILFRVKPRLLMLEVIPQEESILGAQQANQNPEQAAEGAGVNEYFRVKLSSELQGAKKLEIDLIAEDKEGSRYKLPLKKIDNIYETPVSNLPPDGVWQLRAVFSAEVKGKGNRRIKGDSQDLEYVKIKRDETEPVIRVVEETKAPEPKVEEKPMHWMVVLLIITGVNLVGGGAGYFYLMNQQKSLVSTSDELKFEPHDEIQSFIDQLKDKVSNEEVNLDDPIFTDDSIEIQVMDRTSRSSSSDVVVESNAEATPSEEG
ncbi:MAG: hypothetical protein KDD53_12310, partial [Bdellovibrionales bacterium]|nr:hypothetical protein [Bdellovibrionales bacterium]